MKDVDLFNIFPTRTQYSFLLWAWIILPVIGWERRIVVLVNCFMCMLVLVLRIAYGQVVLLWTVLNFVA
jgi:hypothetical protein